MHKEQYGEFAFWCCKSGVKRLSFSLISAPFLSLVFDCSKKGVSVGIFPE